MPKKANPGEPQSVSEHAPTESRRIEFGRRLNDLLIDRGLTQSDLARRMIPYLPRKDAAGGPPKASVSAYISGKRVPGPHYLNAICKVLGVQASDIFPGGGLSTVEDPNPPLDVKSVGGDQVWLRINMQVSWRQAHKVMELLQPAPEAEVDGYHPGGA